MHYPKVSVWRLLGLLALCLWGVAQPAAAHLLVRPSTQPSQAMQAASHHVEFVGQIGGVTATVAVDGNYAYIGVQTRLVILDITSPVAPVVVGQTMITTDLVAGLAVSSGYAYVANGSRGLRVLNVNNPTAPIEVGYYDTPGYASDVTISDGYAYVADGTSGLRVVNVSNPTAPVEVGFYDTPGGAAAVTVVGDYAYVADGTNGLRVVSVSNPAMPTEVGFYDTPGLARDVAVSGGYAYVADDDDGLRVINVDNPAMPIEVGFYETPTYEFLNGVTVIDDYAYVAATSTGIIVVNVSNPATPVETGSHSTPGQAMDVAVSGGYAYVADYWGGLRVIDVRDPETPIETGSHYTLGTPYSAAISGRYAYVADDSNGIRVVDLTNLTMPMVSGFYDTPGNARGIAVSGGYAYVADGSSGLRIVDINNPAIPFEVGFCDTPGYASSVAISGAHVFVADQSGGLRVVNISNPAAPIEVGFYDTPGSALGITVSGSYAYVADGTSGLRVVNISNPATPVEVGFYDTSDSAEDIAVTGNYAYVADRLSGLRIMNVSNPTTPNEIGFYDTPGRAIGVAVSDGYAYIADYWGTMQIVKVSDPAAPTEVGSYGISGLGQGVTVTGGYVYVATQYTGLWILRHVLPPETPALSLIGNGDGDGSYTVSWSNISNAIGYTLQEANNDSFTSAVTGYSGSNTSTSISGKAPGTYYYRVRASNASGDSAWSNTQSVVVVALPTAPTLNAISNADGDGNYSVSWSAVSIATGYTLQEASNSSFTGATTAYSGSGTSTSITGKAPGTYYYRVRSSNIRGDSAWSSTQSVVVVAPPSTPTLNPIANSTGNNSYTVSWSSVSNATSYTLQQADNSDFTNATTAYSGSATQFALNNQPGGTWYYRVRAANVAGNSPWSITRFTTVRPSAPSLYAIANPDGDGDYLVAWTSTVGATAYTLEEDDNPAFNSPLIRYAGSATQVSLTEQGVGDWYYRVRASNTGGASSWSNTRSVTVLPPPWDDYEPDDTCAQAQVISTDGTMQWHNFHHYGDEDWVAFSGTAGTTYIIEALVPPDSTADIQGELYDLCGGGALGDQDHPFTPSFRMEQTAPVDGVYYVRFRNHDPAVYGPTVRYRLSVRALHEAPVLGALIIAAGRLNYNDRWQDHIHDVSNAAYRLFQFQGYPSERIYYLATDLTLDADDDGQPDVDAPATIANLQYAISQWAADKVGPGQPLTLYLVDHGHYDVFYLDDPNGQRLYPAGLHDWLLGLENTTPGLLVNVIIEACLSGSFIDPTQSISREGRVVISSSSASTNAHVAPGGGATFSNAFLDALAQGMSLQGAFEQGQWAVALNHPAQRPWLDANGNRVPNEAADATVAAQRGFAYAGTLSTDQWAPHVWAVELRNLSGGRGEIWADARDDVQVRWVWAIIYPPSYVEPAPGEELVSPPLPVTLQQQGGNWYAGADLFTEIGEYRIIVYAQDAQGLTSLPRELRVRTGWMVYLPVVVKQ